jgi:hypothetical protein
MQKAIITSTVYEDRLKERLQRAIHKKKKMLEEVAMKCEELQVELDIVQHEYNTRIGSLLLKDNQLDLEIIQYRNVKSLMEQGMSYGEAMREIEDCFYSDILRMQKEQETIEFEKEMLNNRHEVSEDVQGEIKQLWKELIRKFHPDLVSNMQEKMKREEIMKKINKAYAENDIDALRLFYANVHVDDFQGSSIEVLEAILVDTENMIISLKEKYKELKQSQWFGWKDKLAKAKKTGEDIFKDFEKSLLNSIVRKIEILRELKDKVVR